MEIPDPQQRRQHLRRNGWFGQSLENRPFVAVGLNGSLFVTDPEMCRVIEFSPVGDPPVGLGRG